MHKYSLTLKKVAELGGVERLDEKKLAVFHAALTLIGTLLRATKEIEDVAVQPDYTLLVVAKEDVSAELEKLADSVNIKRLG